MRQQLFKTISSYMLFMFVVWFAALALATDYELNVNFDPIEKRLEGIEEVSLVPQSTTAYFLLLGNLAREKNPFLDDRGIDEGYPNGFEATSTTIEKVMAVGPDWERPLEYHYLSLSPELQEYSLKENVLAIDLPPVIAGEEVTLRIHFCTNFPRISVGDQGMTEEVFTWRFGWYPLLAARQGDWYEKDKTARLDTEGGFPLELPAASYRATVIVPQDYRLVCGADHIQETQVGGQVEYQAWNDSPVRSIPLTIGPDYGRFTLAELPIPIDVFFLPGHAETARLFATYATDILADYQDRFGSYPRRRLTIVENPNKNGLSFAADGIVWLSNMFFTHRHVTLPGILNRICEFTLAHEIAHQWWGIGVGVDMNAENWLSEGLAQYLAVTYFEGKYGEFGPNTFGLEGDGIIEGFIRSQFDFINLREHQIELPYLMESARGFDETIVKPLDQVQYENASQVRLYDKGYLVARTIASTIGKEDFERGLKKAFELNSHRLITVEGLREQLEQETGQPLEELFTTWLRTPASVDYSVEIIGREETTQGHRTSVRVSRTGGCIQPVILKATLDSGKAIRKEWSGENEEEIISFDSEARVIRVTIDPEHRIPDRERLNNNSPRKFVVPISKPALPLDAYIVQPNPEIRGFTLSYLDRLQVSAGFAGGGIDISKGRNHHLFLSASIAEGGLAGKIGYTYNAYQAVATGSPGTFLGPSTSTTISGHRLLTTGGPLPYLHIGVVEHPSINSSRSLSIGLDLPSFRTGRVRITAFDELRLFPNVYLQGNITLGLGIGELPPSLMFDLEELKSYGWMTKEGWVRAQFPGEHKLYGRMSLEFPLDLGAGFNLINLMRIDRGYFYTFTAAGTSWTGFDEFGKTDPKLELGVEMKFELSAIGGLLPITAVLGYAIPIPSWDGMYYFDFSL
ncbi:MAG: M1 family aminopeptidase [Candidatus Bipolaricaulota bacterium]|nr:M1 family aminopeptidase [Candidatus Bipolaricaulota bacterium]